MLIDQGFAPEMAEHTARGQAEGFTIPLPRRKASALQGGESIVPTDFYSILPQHKYLYVPTRDLWPAESVVGRLGIGHAQTTRPRAGRRPDDVAPERTIDHRGSHRRRWRMGRPPGRPRRQPLPRAESDQGRPEASGIWRDHLRYIYPEEADHIEHWLAHRIQRPGEKINHALVLGGAQGIGKDTLLEPVKHAVGPWNWSEISPGQMLGRFNGWAKSVVVRVSEARDLGDVDRFAFYDHSQVLHRCPARRDPRGRKESAGAPRVQHHGRRHHHEPQDRRHLSAGGRPAPLRRVVRAQQG